MQIIGQWCLFATYIKGFRAPKLTYAPGESGDHVLCEADISPLSNTRQALRSQQLRTYERKKPLQTKHKTRKITSSPEKKSHRLRTLQNSAGLLYPTHKGDTQRDNKTR